MYVYVHSCMIVRSVPFHHYCVPYADVGIATVEDAANRWPLPAANFTSVRHLLGVTNGSTCDLVRCVVAYPVPYSIADAVIAGRDCAACG